MYSLKTVASPLVSAKVFSAPVTVGLFDDVRSAIVHAGKLALGGYVCIANVHMVTTAEKDPGLLSAMESARWVTTDGMPLVWFLKYKGYHAQRVAGPDLTMRICAESADEDLPLYFYGGSPETIRSLEKNLRQSYPGIRIAGLESPPLLPAKPAADFDALARIRASGAKVVFVGLGCPKQEYWMQANSPHSSAIFIGVGAAFDFLAGTVKRAPEWMQRSGLEWLYRLHAEPRRLAGRYFSTNFAFIRAVLAEIMKS